VHLVRAVCHLSGYQAIAVERSGASRLSDRRR
jgi:hypothetical protein